MNYRLEMNSEQARAVIAALDLFSRIGMGQLEEIEHFIAWEGVLKIREPHTLIMRDALRDLCNQMKAILGHPTNGSWGITNAEVPKRCRVAYDLQCVLRQVVGRHEGEQSHSVWLHDPLHVVKDVPLAKCEAVKVLS